VSWVFGDALPGERPGIGGPHLLRAYQTSELVADGVIFSVVEQRFTPFTDMAFDALHLAWLRELQLAFFVGAAGAFDANDGRSRVFAAEVGAGVRLHFDYFGIQPGLFSLDVGVPLVRDEQARSTLPPVTVVVAFEQYF
jgi:hypothetical protein